ncbi:hypothetical protein CP972_17765 [Streptomyces prasinus]|uniref:Uncharacterized protein n=1 Tax=Streptomyces prasinus TaxID=67345 RepID=A0ABX6AWT1_9ACTN|nr:hypothetical protein CP972_17765 [Streptomyces prasinus]
MCPLLLECGPAGSRGEGRTRTGPGAGRVIGGREASDRVVGRAGDRAVGRSPAGARGARSAAVPRPLHRPSTARPPPGGAPGAGHDPSRVRGRRDNVPLLRPPARL